MLLLRRLLSSRVWVLMLKEIQQILKNKQIIFLIIVSAHRSALSIWASAQPRSQQTQPRHHRLQPQRRQPRICVGLNRK